MLNLRQNRHCKTKLDIVIVIHIFQRTFSYNKTKYHLLDGSSKCELTSYIAILHPSLMFNRSEEHQRRAANTLKLNFLRSHQNGRNSSNCISFNDFMLLMFNLLESNAVNGEGLFLQHLRSVTSFALILFNQAFVEHSQHYSYVALWSICSELNW